MKYYAFCDDGEVVYVGDFPDMQDADEYYQKHLYRRVSGNLEENVGAIWFFSQPVLSGLVHKIYEVMREANTYPARKET